MLITVFKSVWLPAAAADDDADDEWGVGLTATGDGLDEGVKLLVPPYRPVPITWNGWEQIKTRKRKLAAKKWLIFLIKNAK